MNSHWIHFNFLQFPRIGERAAIPSTVHGLSLGASDPQDAGELSESPGDAEEIMKSSRDIIHQCLDFADKNS